jgi:hypothetical protein
VATTFQTRFHPKPAGHLRQWLGGLLLLACGLAPPAFAADAASPAAADPQRTAAPGESRLSSFKQRVMALLPGFVSHPFTWMRPAADNPPRDPMESLREKYGIRVAPPDPGSVYVAVMQGPDSDAGSGALTADGNVTAALESRDRAWLPSGLQDLSAPDHNPMRQVRFTPQLMMNVNDVTDLPGRLQLGLTYRSWACPETGAFTDVRPIPQMSLRWSYN